MGATFLFLVLAERRAERLGEHVGDGRFAKHAFDTRGGSVEPAVQGAKIQRVVRITERALGDAPRRRHGRDNCQQGQRVRRDGQREPAVEPALRCDDAAAAQRLKNLRQVARRDAGALGDLLGGERGPSRLCGQAQDRPQRIFRRL